MNSLSSHLNSVQGKKVIVRCNFDVPIKSEKVTDTTRIEDSIPTLNAILEKGGELILLAHYDRPDGKFSSKKSLLPVKDVLEKLLRHTVSFVEYQKDYRQLSQLGWISLVDNLRFWPEEEKNDSAFAKHLASLGDIYINEAFANCHREHTSIVGIPKHLPSYAGLSLEKEMTILKKIRNHPDKPLVVIIGGAKLETKEPLIDAFVDKADYILAGGKIAVDLKGKTNLPKNVIVADVVDSTKDITETSARHFAEIINQAKTIVWNGSMGMFEDNRFMPGTRIVGTAIATSKAFSVVGGGDTEAALTILNIDKKIDYVSTGGGAMLTYLSTGELVGIKALTS